jgi:xanthine dehydrogenase accessory factor
MHSADLEVLHAALGWLDEGRRVALATVVRTFGSAPRPVGALLALCDDGRLSGSVSGGCIEADLLERVGREFPCRPALCRYGVTADEARRFGLPCGGVLELVLEPLADAAGLAAIRDALAARRSLTRVLDLDRGEVSVQAAPSAAAGCSFDGHTLARVFGPRWRLLVIGAGQIAHYLASLAATLDYDVRVCDPREEYARSWTDPAVAVSGDMPDDVVREFQADARSVIVALTHDPKLDDMALMEALRSHAFYVGALGSRASQAKRRARLLQLDLSPQEVARLHGPVGYPLGGKTPPEIALAILAEVTALRNGVRLVPASGPAGRTAAPAGRLPCAGAGAEISG